MATQDKDTKSSKFDPPTTTEDAVKNAERADQDSGEDKLVVPPHEGVEHGYIGHRPRTEPNESFTVAGVTGGTGNVADTPKSAKKS
jgi:hypothetical protein